MGYNNWQYILTCKPLVRLERATALSACNSADYG